MDGNLYEFLSSPAAVKWGLGVVATGLATLTGFVVRTAIAAIKDKATKAEQTLRELKEITAVQAENHLTTIQGEALKQTKLLEDMKCGQIEANASLKTLISVIGTKA